jgi:dTDP-4-dehydrorhamnose reductase
VRIIPLGVERDEVAVLDAQRGCPTYVGHLAAATRELVDGGAAFGIWHLAADGDCTWADFAETIFVEASLGCRVRRITTAEFGARAPRPAVSILRSEKGAPVLPHWREGLRACLAVLA